MAYDVWGMVLWAVIFILIWKFLTFVINAVFSRGHEEVNWKPFVIVVVVLLFAYAAYANRLQITNWIGQASTNIKSSATLSATSGEVSSIVCEDIISSDKVYVAQNPLDEVVYFESRRNPYENGWAPLYVIDAAPCGKGSAIGENINHFYCSDLVAFKESRVIDYSGRVQSQTRLWYQINLEIKSAGETVPDPDSLNGAQGIRLLHVFDVVDPHCKKIKEE